MTLSENLICTNGERSHANEGYLVCWFLSDSNWGEKGLSNKDDLDNCVHQFGYELIIQTVRPKTIHALFGPVSVFLQFMISLVSAEARAQGALFDPFGSSRSAWDLLGHLRANRPSVYFKAGGTGLHEGPPTWAIHVDPSFFSLVLLGLCPPRTIGPLQAHTISNQSELIDS